MFVNQLFISFKQFCSRIEYFVGVRISMSSAYKLYFILGNLFIIYLMGSLYMANKIGDKIEPCGTPYLSLYGLDIVVFILMEKVLT